MESIRLKSPIDRTGAIIILLKSNNMKEGPFKAHISLENLIPPGASRALQNFYVYLFRYKMSHSSISADMSRP